MRLRTWRWAAACLCGALRSAAAEEAPEPRSEPQSPLSEVQFVSYRADDRLQVTAGGKSCWTPCELKLRPGFATVRTDESPVEMPMTIPHLTSTVKLFPQAPRWHTVLGAIFVPLGAAVATSLWALGVACNNVSGCLVANLVGWPLVGLSLVITGIVLLVSGERHPPEDANWPEIIDTRAEPRADSQPPLESSPVAPAVPSVNF